MNSLLINNHSGSTRPPAGQIESTHLNSSRLKLCVNYANSCASVCQTHDFPHAAVDWTPGRDLRFSHICPLSHRNQPSRRRPTKATGGVDAQSKLPPFQDRFDALHYAHTYSRRLPPLLKVGSPSARRNQDKQRKSEDFRVGRRKVFVEVGCFG